MQRDAWREVAASLLPPIKLKAHTSPSLSLSLICPPYSLSSFKISPRKRQIKQQQQRLIFSSWSGLVKEVVSRRSYSKEQFRKFDGFARTIEGERKIDMGFRGCVYSSSSLSVKLLCFTVLLVFVYGFVCVLGPIASPSPSSSSSSSDNWAVVSTSYGKYIPSPPPPPPPPLFSAESSSTGKIVDVEEKTLEITEQSVLANQYASTSSPPPPDVVHDGISGGMKNIPANVTWARVTAPAPAPAPGPAPLYFDDELVKVASDLERLESGLHRARAAIKEAKSEDKIYDPDYNPNGPMYWNANAFHRSYLEMEKRFKVYVYEDGEPPLFHNGPCKSIYSTEGNFIHQMEVSSFRTRNPNMAQAFFLPFSVAKLVQFVYPRDSRDFGPIKKTIRDYIKIVSTKYTFWNQSLGADHFMLSCHDWGPHASLSVPDLHHNSIRVLCNANTSEGFKPEKDVSFPEINLVTGHMRGFVGGPSASRRPILAFFAGGLHGPIRPILLDYWENNKTVKNMNSNMNMNTIQVYRYLPKGIDYYEMLRKSRYCLCPSGYEVASPRIVEAIYTGCVPVLINDHYVPPFGDVLNWKSFSVKVSPEDIPNLKEILEGISSRRYIRMQRRVVQIRRHFEVHNPPKRYDAFHMVLHSVWLRRLNVRIRDHQDI